MRNPLRTPLRLVTRTGAALAALLVVMVVAAPPTFAAPALEVSQLTGLEDGQTVTISGSGFEPNLSSIAIGQCVEGYTGPADCNINGGASFRNADAQGNVPDFTVVVKEVFGAHDCTKSQCVIAAGPIPGQADEATIAANTAIYEISFGAPVENAAATQPDAPADAPAAAAGDDQASLPQTGAGDSVPVMLLAATALLALGGGVILLVPGRRRALR